MSQNGNGAFAKSGRFFACAAMISANGNALARSASNAPERKSASASAVKCFSSPFGEMSVRIRRTDFLTFSRQNR